jgi:membrane protein DedA with SNARE-associated domain
MMWTGDDAAMSAGLPGPLTELAPVLDQYGYLALAGFVLVESFGVPVPAQTLLIVAGIYAGDGRLNVVLVGLVAFMAAVTGDSIGFWIGRAGGRRLVLRLGRYVLLTEERLNKAEGFFERHGGKIVAVARFVDGLRQFNGVVAGVVNMPWWRFLAFNALGAVLWASLWAGLGDLAGQHIDRIYGEVLRYQTYLLIALAVAAAVPITRWLWRRHTTHRHVAPADS